MSALFRAEVVNHARLPYGAAIQWQPPRLQTAVVGLLLLTAGLALLVLSQPYTRKIPVQGLTQTGQATTVVPARQAGTISRLYVTVGMQVTAGQKLAAISRVNYDGQGVSDVVRAVSQTRAALAISAARMRTYKQVRQRGLAAQQRQTSSLQQQLRLADQRGQILQQLVKTARADFSRLRGLAERRLISVGELESARAQWLDTRRGELEHQATRAALQQELTQVRDALSVYQAETELEVVQLAGRHAALQRELHELEAGGQALLLAPHDGQVADIAQRAGAYVGAASPVLSLRATQGENLVELWLPSAARGQIEQGQRVQLRIRGYPQQEFGLARGVVQEVAMSSAGPGGEYRFRAQVGLLSLPLGVTELPSGMLVEGDIELESQTLWRWLLRPLSEFLLRL